MSKEKYINPDFETLSISIDGILCQSSLGDIGTGSLDWNIGDGTDPGGSGDDFEWGN